MVKKLNISRLKYRAKFCPVKVTVNDISGAKVRGPDIEKGQNYWCGIYDFTIGQKLNTTGVELTDSKTLIVRHGLNIDENMYVIFQNQTYLISDITEDDSDIVTYDLVSMKEVS